MPALDGTLDWTHPALALAVAPLATLCIVLLARRGLVRGAARTAWPAALARGLAAGLAVLAAAGPVIVERDEFPGRLIVAHPAGFDAPEADLTLAWPSQADDAASALEILRSARDPERETRIVLTTDGRTGSPPGDPAVTRALAPAPGLEPALLGLKRVEEATASSSTQRTLELEVPAGAAVGVPVALTLSAGRRPFLGGWAEFSLGTRSERVLLPPGASRVPMPPVLLPAGTHLAQAVVSGRDPAVSLVPVAGEPSVLLLTRSSRESLALSELLEAQGIRVMVAGSAAGFSQALEEASAIIVGPGTGGGALGAAACGKIRAGTGLLVLGGPEHAGLSRLHGSKLAEILPVEVPRPAPQAPRPDPPERDPDKDPDGRVPELDEGEKHALRVALLICMDRSGSMDGRKLVLARAAAIAAARNLAPTDFVGVLAFSDGFQWVAPFQPAVKLDLLARRMREVRAGGWTNFFPPLKAGYQAIAEQPCGIKHMILFTDGKHNAGATVFGPLVLEGTRAGVTLSTVAVGDDAASNLLAQMAGWGRGGYYWAQDPERLPAVLTMDTQEYTAKVRQKRMEERDRRPEGLPGETPDQPGPGEPGPESTGDPAEPETPGRWPRTPTVSAPAPALAGLDDAEWPALAFPEDVDPRPASHAPLVWDSGAPALAFGRAGLGRTAVLAADVTTAQAAEFRSWEHSGRFLGQLVRSLIQPVDRRRERPTVRFFELPDGRAYVRVDGGSGGMLELDGLDGGTSLRVGLQRSDGCALGELDRVPPRGAYAGVLTENAGRTVRLVAVSRGPGLALRIPTVDDIALRAGVPVLDTVPEAPEGLPRERREPADAVLLLGAIGLLVVEAAFRRAARAGDRVSRSPDAG